MPRDAKGWVDAKDSGWYYAHEAIRADVRDMLTVLDRLATTASPAKWELDSLLIVWGYVVDFIHHHHEHEEHFFFPKLKERVELPPRLETDHKTMVEMLTATDALFKAEHAKSSGYNWAEVASSLRALEAVMLPHLLEEEVDTLPAMMSNFTAKDFEPVENKMIKQLPWHTMGHIYRRLKDDMDAKRKHATETLGVPGVIWSQVLRPRIERYQAEVGWHFEALLLPQSRAFWDEQIAMYRARRGACGCFRPRPMGSKAQHFASAAPSTGKL